MTRRQQAFVEQYLIDRNATAAARRAGYSDASYGRQLLTLPHVYREIERQEKAMQARAGLTVERVRQQLWKEATDYGEGASHSARVSALDKLMRHLGGYARRADDDHGEIKAFLDALAEVG